VQTRAQAAKRRELTIAAAKAQARLVGLTGVLPAAALRHEHDTAVTAEKARTTFENSLPHVLMSTSGSPRTVRILPRGNWLDDSGPITSPNTPGFLPALPEK